LEPYPITCAEERPVETVPAIERWSENYAFVGYDYDQRIGFSAYAGRWVKRPDLWREQFYMCLPDGSSLVHIAIGPAVDRQVAGSSALRLICEEAGGRWRIKFDGAMRHETSSSLLAEPVVETEPHPVSFSATLDHQLPVWMMPSSDNESYGKFHYEQMGHCTARLDFAEKHYEFSGPSYRDHSRGPRHLGGFDGHVWLQVHLKDAAPVSIYQAWARDDGKLVQILDAGVSFHPDRLGKAALLSDNRLQTLDALADPIPLILEADGRVHRLTARAIAGQFASLNDDFDFFYGFHRGRADILATEQPLLLEGEDGIATGYLQRSLRIPRDSLKV
jgi:hypothetical protein